MMPLTPVLEMVAVQQQAGCRVALSPKKILMGEPKKKKSWTENFVIETKRVFCTRL